MKVHKPSGKDVPTTVHEEFSNQMHQNETTKIFEPGCCVCGKLQQSFRDHGLYNLYDPLVRHERTWMFTVKVAAQELNVESADVDDAYLYGNMDKRVVMIQATDSFG